MSYHRVGAPPNQHYVGDISEEERASHPATPPRSVTRVLGNYAGIGAPQAQPRPVARVLGHYVSGLGEDADASRTREAGGSKAVISSSTISRMNAEFARALRPAYGAIDALSSSILSPGDRSRLKNKPLDFFLDLFDPIEDIVVGAIARVNAATGKQSRNFFGTTVDMRANPPSDNRLDTSVKNFVKRLRTIQQFMTLVVLEPIRFNVELIAGGLQAGLNFAQINTTSSTLAAVSVAELKRLFMTFPLVTNVPAGLTFKFNALGPITFQTVNENGVLNSIGGKDEFAVFADANNRNPVRKLLGFVPAGMSINTTSRALFGYGGGLGGDPATATVPAIEAAAEVTSLTGIPMLDAFIAGLLLSVNTAVDTAIGIALLRFQNGQNPLTGQSLITGPSGGSTTSTPRRPAPPTKIGPANGGAQSSGGGAPPNGGAQSAGGGTSVASGIPPVVFVAGAAALVFFLLRSSSKKRT